MQNGKERFWAVSNIKKTFDVFFILHILLFLFRIYADVYSYLLPAVGGISALSQQNLTSKEYFKIEVKD